jgi:hypothetical protein
MSHLSLFDLMGDEALRYLQRLVQESTHVERLDVEFENFGNAIRAELQHREAEHDLVGIIYG